MKNNSTFPSLFAPLLLMQTITGVVNNTSDASFPAEMENFNRQFLLGSGLNCTFTADSARGQLSEGLLL